MGWVELGETQGVGFRAPAKTEPGPTASTQPTPTVGNPQGSSLDPRQDHAGRNAVETPALHTCTPGTAPLCGAGVRAAQVCPGIEESL